MFRAIRESLAVFGQRVSEGFHHPRLQHLFRLFLFEFVVVLLGVLTAQALADWSDKRESDSRSREALEVYRRDLADGRETIQLWLAGAPCLDRRVSAISITAANGGRIDPAMVRRPGLWSSSVDPMDVDTRVYAQRVLGSAWLQKANDAAIQINRIATKVESVASRWMQFNRVDPANGRVREGDMLAARDAAAAIQADLRSIVISAELGDAGLREIGIAPSRSIVDGTRRRPVHSCEEMARAGEISVSE